MGNGQPDKEDMRLARLIRMISVAALLLDARPASAEEDSGAMSHESICALIETEAGAERIPPGFLARLIWKESRFNRYAVSPKGAQGIAQFMPQTAAERRLSDPFDIPSSIKASAALLADLSEAFGNLGLAAAAYNAGSDRVARWIAGNSYLPAETQDYVFSITGIAAGDWTEDDVTTPDFVLDDKLTFKEACVKLASRGPAPIAIAEGPRKPWGMQVTANFSRDRAVSSFVRLQRRYGSILGGVDPIVLRTRAPARGSRALFAVRVGAETRQEAETLCGKLRAAGGSCVVFRN